MIIRFPFRTFAIITPGGATVASSTVTLEGEG